MRGAAGLALTLLLSGAVPGGAQPAPELPAPVLPVEREPGASPDDSEAALAEELLLEEEILQEQQDSSPPDPVEGMNRGILHFNRGLDLVLIDPVTRLYGWVMPAVGKRTVRRFFDNLGSIPVLVNDLLQLEGRRAGVTGSRLLVNSTVGVAGLLDPATAWGLRRHHSDFGQTLWVHGVESGPYLVLPVLGPSTARDAVGRLVDGAMRPDTWLLGGAEIFLLGVGDGLSLREMHLAAIEELKRSSIDYYAALRSVYWMNRQHELVGGSSDPGLGATQQAPGSEEVPPDMGSEGLPAGGDSH